VFRLFKIRNKILDDGGGGTFKMCLIKNLVSKGSNLFKICFLFFLMGCQSDISFSDQRKSHVVIDSFIQEDQIESLDILVVVDTSGSMSDNFDEVGMGMDSLRLDIENLTHDYQFGFITTDSQNLSYVGPFDSSSSSIDIMLATSLLSLVPGEEGFSSTYVFLNSDDGISFIRPDSDFLLFLVSDEDEQGSISAEAFRDWLVYFFPDVSHDIVSITAIPGGTCGSYGQFGEKYTELANLYGKDSLDICDETWSLWLSESSFITRQKDYIELSDENPILESIVVYENHVSISDWEYIEIHNTIQLGFLPDPGDLIEVGYKVYD